MSLGYPVDTSLTWSLWSIPEQRIVRRNMRWPRHDGMDPGLTDHLFLMETINEEPSFTDELYTLEMDENISVENNTVVRSWVPTPRYGPVEMVVRAKLYMLELIKAKRDSREASQFYYDGHTYDADSNSIIRISHAGLVALKAHVNDQAFSLDWADAEGNIVTLSKQDILGMQQALVVHSNACHTTARTHAIAMNQLTTPQAILRYDYSTGWPG